MGILQPVSGADDRLGSFASFPRCPSYVRLCSKTGDKADIARGRICAHFRNSCTAALRSPIRSPHRCHALAGTPLYRVLHIGVGRRALPVATSSGQTTTCLPSCHWIVTAL